MKKLLLVMVAGLLLGADDSDAIKKDLEKMQGDWIAVTYTSEGKPTDKADLAKIKLNVKGDTSTFQKGERVGKGTYKLDPTKKPKALDILLLDGPNKGTSVLGIYEIDGD